MKYSVIIPVYKAEKTIEKCVESLLNQPHADVQILLINDGSPDRSGEICRSLAGRHSCVHYFEKENGGVSSARNLGLSHAKGEYILFVDSDDYVTPGYFAAITGALERNRPDLMLFGIRSIGAKSREWAAGDYAVEEEIAVARKTAKALRACLFFNLMSKVFRRDIIERYHLRFDESLAIGEDQLFVFQYTMHIKKLASISDALYCLVCENANSLSRKRRDYLAEQLLRVNLRMLEALQAAGHGRRAAEIYFDAVVWSNYRSAYSACKELLKYDLTAVRRREKIKEICRMFHRDEMKPRGLPNRIIALPVQYRISRVIDILTTMFWGRRRDLH